MSSHARTKWKGEEAKTEEDNEKKKKKKARQMHLRRRQTPACLFARSRICHEGPAGPQKTT